MSSCRPHNMQKGLSRRPIRWRCFPRQSCWTVSLKTATDVFLGQSGTRTISFFQCLSLIFCSISSFCSLLKNGLIYIVWLNGMLSQWCVFVKFGLLFQPMNRQLHFLQSGSVLSVRINLPSFSTVLSSNSCCLCPVGLSLLIQHFQQVLWVLKLFLFPGLGS